MDFAKRIQGFKGLSQFTFSQLITILIVSLGDQMTENEMGIKTSRDLKKFGPKLNKYE